MIYRDTNFSHKTILITGSDEYFPNPYEGCQIYTQVDISTSQVNLGFEPVFSIEEGIKTYISDIKCLHYTDIS